MSTHPCPGGCGTPVPRRRFACRGCWYRLPRDLRGPITAFYGVDRFAHAEAMIEAADWYRENPLAAPGPSRNPNVPESGRRSD